MMESMGSEQEKVLIAKDDGYKRQWGVGRLFVKWEGAKRRVDSRALFVAIAICFVLTALIGLFRGGQKPFNTKSSIPVVSTISASEVLPIYDPTSPSIGPISKVNGESNFHSSANSVNKLAIVRRSGLQKIQPGIFAQAKLLTGASNGFVKAVITEDVTGAGELFFPAETYVVGSAQSSIERLQIQFSKAVLPDGTVIDIKAQACDGSDKKPGLSGVNVQGQALSLAGAVGLNFAGGIALGMQQNRADQNAPQKPTMRDGLLNGAAVAALERGKEISQDFESEPPLIEVEEGTIFYLLFLDGG